MADEKDEGAEGVVDLETTPVEGEETVEEITDDPSVVELAKQVGWTPKEEFKGDPNNWKPAAQFILDGKDIQRQQSRDLRELRSTVDNISRTSAQILADRIEQEKSRLSTEYAAAVEEGDPQKAWQIGQKINSLDTPTQPSVRPETAAWVSRNPWFQSDPLAQHLAIKTANDLAHLPAEQQLEAAEREVKRVYPHLFANGGNGGKPPAGVAPPGSRAAVTAPRAKGFGDMPKEAQKIASDMVERKVIPSLDHYTRNYWATEGKAK